jgi:hypothetical protein
VSSAEEGSEAEKWAGNSCPLCGSPIVGREAVEVRQEHRDLIVSAKTGRTLAEKAEGVAGDLRSWSRYRVDDTDELHELRKDVQNAARELTRAQAVPGRRWLVGLDLIPRHDPSLSFRTAGKHPAGRSRGHVASP